MNDFNKAFNDCINNIERIGKEYAKAKSESWFLDEMKKTVLSQAMKELPPELAISEKEHRARRSSSYFTHLEGTKVAIQREHELRTEYDALCYRFESIRSLCSLDKKQMEIL